MPGAFETRAKEKENERDKKSRWFWGKSWFKLVYLRRKRAGCEWECDLSCVGCDNKVVW